MKHNLSFLSLACITILLLTNCSQNNEKPEIEVRESIKEQITFSPEFQNKVVEEYKKEELLNSQDSINILPHKATNGKIGYINLAGEWIIKPKYNKARAFVNGVAPIKIYDKWIFINTKGDTILRERYQDVGTFSDSIANVKGNNDLWGYINLNGDTLTEFKYKWASEFKNGIAMVIINDDVLKNKYMFINKNFENRFVNTYYHAKRFSEGLAIVQETNNRYFSILDTTGTIISTYLSYESLNSFSEGIATANGSGIDKTGEEFFGIKADYIGPFNCNLAVAIEFGEEGGESFWYINNKGESAFDGYFISGGNFSECLAPVCMSYSTMGYHYYGYLNKKGELEIPLQFKLAEEFKNGLAKVNYGEKEGFINKSGKIISAAQVDEVRPFSEGFAAVKVIESENLFGYINMAGRFIANPQFIEAKDFSEGMAAVKYLTSNVQKLEDGQNKTTEITNWGYINRKGEIVIENKFDEAGSFSEGLAPVKVKELYGYINTKGDTVIPPQFEDALTFSEGLAAAKSNGKWGYITYDGQWYIKPVYKEVSNFNNDFAFVAQFGPFEIINKQNKVLSEGIFKEINSFGWPQDISEGYILKKKKDDYTIYRLNGETVFTFSAYDLFPFSEGLAIFNKDIDEKYLAGAIDTSGQIIFTYDCISINEFHNGLAKFYSNPPKYGISMYGYINKEGTVIIEPQFEEASDFVEGLALVKRKWYNKEQRKYFNKFGFIDIKGNFVKDLEWYSMVK